MRLCYIALLCCSYTVWASCPGQFDSTTDQQWNQFRLHSDVKRLGPLLSDGFVLTHSDGRLENKQSYLQDLASSNRVNTQIENFDVQIRCFENTALVTGRTLQQGISAGKKWQGEFRFTRVWFYQNNQWLLQASHSSRLR
ncbi:nuclear transport factor 2 family protein [Rheinheimera faecalis]